MKAYFLLLIIATNVAYALKVIESTVPLKVHNN